MAEVVIENQSSFERIWRLEMSDQESVRKLDNGVDLMELGCGEQEGRNG
jgi:hypothetical protein